MLHEMRPQIRQLQTSQVGTAALVKRCVKARAVAVLHEPRARGCVQFDEASVVIVVGLLGNLCSVGSSDAGARQTALQKRRTHGLVHVSYLTAVNALDHWASSMKPLTLTNSTS